MSKLKNWRGDRRAEDVAAKLRVTVAMWSRWETGSRQIPANRVLDIEALTGVSRHELRPDIFGPEQAVVK
jgi:DNA-binding transcriptional regulator YdaS (Cro superfamily)